jgi:hypothetical protein
MLGLSFRRSSPTLRQNLLVSNSVSKATRGLYLLLIVLLIAASKLVLFRPLFFVGNFGRKMALVIGGALTSAVNLNNPLANQFK